MKLKVAHQTILAHLEKRISIEPRIQNLLHELYTGIPDALDFSIQTSRKALQSVPNARIPSMPIELVGWLEDIAEELYRVGMEKHTTCSCGCSHDVHVLSAYIRFLIGYLSEELAPIFAQLISSYAERLYQGIEDFEKFRPSDN